MYSVEKKIIQLKKQTGILLYYQYMCVVVVCFFIIKIKILFSRPSRFYTNHENNIFFSGNENNNNKTFVTVIENDKR